MAVYKSSERPLLYGALEMPEVVLNAIARVTFKPSETEDLRLGETYRWVKRSFGYSIPIAHRNASGATYQRSHGDEISYERFRAATDLRRSVDKPLRRFSGRGAIPSRFVRWCRFDGRSATCHQKPRTISHHHFARRIMCSA